MAEAIRQARLRRYREAHHPDAGLLLWHEAQVRANLGQYPEAISLRERRISGQRRIGRV